MGDNPLEMVENVGLNFVTGGLYSIGKAALSDDPVHALMVQGLDVGLASTFNQSLVDTFGDEAGMAFNAAGGALGAAGAMGAFSSLPGFAPGGGVAATAVPGSSGLTGAAALTEGGPIVATGTPTPLAPGALSSTTAAAPSGSGVLAQPGYVAGQGPPLLNPTSIASTTGVPSSVESSIAQAGQSFRMVPEGNPAAVKGWWDSLSAGTQSALVLGGTMAGGQMLTGAMGGLFQGMSAQKKLELEQLINEQNQAQRQYLNANNQYAPSLTFKKPVTKPVGVLATPK